MDMGTFKKRFTLRKDAILWNGALQGYKIGHQMTVVERHKWVRERIVQAEIDPYLRADG